jgi:hypothetical protein
MGIGLDESSIIKANFQFWEQMLAMSRPAEWTQATNPTIFRGLF